MCALCSSENNRGCAGNLEVSVCFVDGTDLNSIFFFFFFNIVINEYTIVIQCYESCLCFSYLMLLMCFMEGIHNMTFLTNKLNSMSHLCHFMQM